MDTHAKPSDTDPTFPPVAVERLPGGEQGVVNDSAKDYQRTQGRAPMHWLLEGIFIVVSVLLGFSLTEFGQYRSERELAARMLTSVRTEVEYNRALLSRFVPIHRTWQAALAAEDPSSGTGSAVDVLLARRPTLPAEFTTNVPVLRRAAWDTALSTGALRLIDYDLAAGLSEIYGMQDYAGATFPKLFSDPSFFDPTVRSATITLSQTIMRELVFAEETLLGLYEKHLPAILERADR